MDKLEQLMDVVAGPLGVLVLEHTGGGRFRLYGKEPAWLRQLGEGSLQDPGTLFPFLDVFLGEAEAVWKAERSGVRVSDFWTQRAKDGSLHLIAKAIKHRNVELLTVGLAEESYRDQQLLAQHGRESRLLLDQLEKETRKKEILVHCVAHDLAAPTNAVLSTLGLIGEAKDGLPAELHRLVQSAAGQLQREQRLIAEILKAFAMEQRDLAHMERTIARAPDAVLAAKTAIEQLSPQADLQSVQLAMTVGPGTNFQVMGDETYLERVFAALLENALRFSPRDATVKVRIWGEGARVKIAFDDEGPGVPPALRPSLFDRFSAPSEQGGRMGLGLYYCAMIVRRWGGEIAALRSPAGGARFELTLLRPPDAFDGLAEQLGLE